MRMSKIILLAVMCTGLSSWCQQLPTIKPSVPQLVAKLHSSHLVERSEAIDEIRSDSVALHSRRVQETLIDLLDKENKGSPEDTASEDDEGEEYPEYFASLRETVNSFADWNDPRQACILVYAGSNDYPSSPQRAAARARAAMPCLLRRSKSDVAIDREIASIMLVEALARGKEAVDMDTAQSARQIILSHLQDKDDGVRASTVDALSKFGGIDMIPALKLVASNDPSPEVEGHSIRKSAAEAIAAIQKRTGHD